MAGYIEDTLERFYQCPSPPGLVDLLLLTGRAMVVFDGLDELLDTSRRADISARVERFCAEYPLAPVLVTSRVVGYDQARLDDGQFRCYRLAASRTSRSGSTRVNGSPWNQARNPVRPRRSSPRAPASPTCGPTR